MTASTLRTVRPDEHDIAAAVAALPHIRAYLASHHGQSVTLLVDEGPPEDSLTVPRASVELLARILGHMADGEGVTVIPTQAELTTQQAADLLNVSRPYLIGLLTAGEIEYRTVGKHRRVKADSLLRYMAEDDRRRRAAADELTALSQEMGL